VCLLVSFTLDATFPRTLIFVESSFVNCRHICIKVFHFTLGRLCLLRFCLQGCNRIPPEACHKKLRASRTRRTNEAKVPAEKLLAVDHSRAIDARQENNRANTQTCLNQNGQTGTEAPRQDQTYLVRWLLQLFMLMAQFNNANLAADPVGASVLEPAEREQPQRRLQTQSHSKFTHPKTRLAPVQALVLQWWHLNHEPCRSNLQTWT